MVLTCENMSQKLVVLVKVYHMDMRKKMLVTSSKYGKEQALK